MLIILFANFFRVFVVDTWRFRYGQYSKCGSSMVMRQLLLYNLCSGVFFFSVIDISMMLRHFFYTFMGSCIGLFWSPYIDYI